jgi:hypothetical protein
MERIMSGVGYIAGRTLDEIQEQWVALGDVEIDQVIFDEKLRRIVGNLDNYDKLSKEEKEIDQYVQSMLASMSVAASAGNYDRYYEVKDLEEGDVLVLISLDILFYAKPMIWDDIMAQINKGVGLVILEHGFDSRGDYGDVMIRKMDKLYRLGQASSTTSKGKL